MQLVYFASLREKIGIGEETLAKPDTVQTVDDLIMYLRQQGPNYKTALENTDLIRVAVNHVHVKHDMLLSDHDEIAFFPPVTGG